jgi:hypothetical protein
VPASRRSTPVAIQMKYYQGLLSARLPGRTGE